MLPSAASSLLHTHKKFIFKTGSRSCDLWPTVHHNSEPLCIADDKDKVAELATDDVVQMLTGYLTEAHDQMRENFHKTMAARFAELEAWVRKAPSHAGRLDSLTDSEPDFEKILQHAAENALNHDPHPLEDLAKACGDVKTDLQTCEQRYGLPESDVSEAKDTLDVAWSTFYELELLAAVQQFRNGGKTDIKILGQLLNRVACELFSMRSGGRRLNPTMWNYVNCTIDGGRVRK